jgi:hypothetical protein
MNQTTTVLTSGLVRFVVYLNHALCGLFFLFALYFIFQAGRYVEVVPLRKTSGLLGWAAWFLLQALIWHLRRMEPRTGTANRLRSRVAKRLDRIGTPLLIVSAFALCL